MEASSSPHVGWSLPQLFRIQIASFVCLRRSWDSLSTTFAPSQSISSLSVVVWSVMIDLLMVNCDHFFSLLMYEKPSWKDGESLYRYLNCWICNEKVIMKMNHPEDCSTI